MSLVASNQAARPLGTERLPGRVNYFIGTDPARWHTNVPTFSKIRVPEVYPGIDLVYYGNGRELEYDFIVAPSGDPNVIRLKYEGADRLFLTADGDLSISAKGRVLVQRRPRVYQRLKDGLKNVGAAYVLSGDSEIAFQVADRDHEHELVIDPVLEFSRYLGGSVNSTGQYGGADDAANSVAVDSTGVYIAGKAVSSDFPKVHSLSSSSTLNSGAGVGDAFISKLDPDGQSLLYSTYLGGSDVDWANSIAVDSTGHAYIAGGTDSSDVPVARPLQASVGGKHSVFVAKLSPDGSQLEFSSQIRGTGTDYALGIAVDSSGLVYVVGSTNSNDFPHTQGRLPSSPARTDWDGFIVKLDLSSTNTSFVYSRYLGGSGDDQAWAVTADSSGYAYVTGGIGSTDFQITNSSLSTPAGARSGNGDVDAFVVKITPSGSDFVYSTLLGGSDAELGEAIAIDSTGNAFVGGYTKSSDFPLASPIAGHAPSACAVGDAFLSKLNPTGTELIYSNCKFVHGTITGLAVDGLGHAFITGNFAVGAPVANPLQSITQGGAAYAAELSSDGESLLYATFLGGSNWDISNKIAIDTSDAAYVVGTAQSNDFPTVPVNPRESSRTDRDAFVLKISPVPYLTLTSLSPAFASPAGGMTVTITGGNFPADQPLSVTFGSAPATDVTYLSPIAITATAPSNDVEGAVDVTVTNLTTGDQSTLAAAFTYTYSPSVSAISPTSGSSVGGILVTIHGEHFKTGASVTFGALAAQGVSVIDSATITAITPTQPAATVDVVVTNPDGQSGTLPKAYVVWKQEKHSGCSTGGSSSILALLLAVVALRRIGRRERVALRR